MRLLLTSEELATLIETYETYGLKEFIKFTVAPYESEDFKGLKQRFEVTFAESSIVFEASFIFKAGIEHGKKGLL
jgi:hypothetical protein